MIILLPVFLLFLAWLVMLIMRFARPRFAFYWLIATLATLMTWMIILLIRFRIPLSLIPIEFQASQILHLSVVLMVDQYSWPYLMAFASICLGVTLTSVMRFPQEETQSWSNWSISTLVNLTGLLCLLAGNLFTLLLTWMLYSLLDMVIQVSSSTTEVQISQTVWAGITRLSAIMALIGVGVANQIQLDTFDIPSPSPITINLLLLISGLWCSSVIWLSSRQHNIDQGIHTILLLAPITSGLLTITRFASSDLPYSSTDVNKLLLLIVSLAALLFSIKWASAPDEQSGKVAWIMTGVLLSLFSGLIHQPAASLAWGLNLLLVGSALLMSCVHTRLVNAIPLLSMINMIAFPFSSLWQSIRVYSLGSSTIEMLMLIIILLSHSLLLAGYFRHTWRVNEQPEGLERWMWIIYPIGLLLMPVTLFFVSYWNPLKGTNSLFNNPSLPESWPSLAVLLVAASLALITQRQPRLHFKIYEILENGILSTFIKQFASAFYKLTTSIVQITDHILEGPGGILWALLFLAILITFLLQQFTGV